MTYFDIARDLGYTERDAVMRSYQRFKMYLKTGKSILPEDFLQSEIPKPGSVLLSSITDQLEKPLPYATERLHRMTRSFGYPVEDTIAGYTLDEKDAEALVRWLRDYTAIRPSWDIYCSNHKIPSSQAGYHKFLQTIKRKNYVVCKNHPCCHYNEFLPGSESDVLKIIQITYAEVDESAIHGYMTIKLAGAKLGVSESCMEAWLIEHPKWISTIAGVPYIKNEDLNTLVGEWSQCIDAETYDWFGFRAYLDQEVYRQFASRVMYEIRTKLIKLSLPLKTYPQQCDRKIWIPPKNIRLIEQKLYDDYLVPVSAFKKAAYTTELHLRDAIKAGKLDGAIINRQYYLRPDQLISYMEMEEKCIPIEVVVKEHMGRINSDFDANRKVCWDELIRFCEEFGWWDIWHAEQDVKEVLFATKYSPIYIRVEDARDLCQFLNIWLETYGKNPAEEFETRLKIHRTNFPVTVKALNGAFPDADSRTVAACEMIDMLFYMLGKYRQDINSLSKHTIEDMIEKMRSECSIAACTKFVDFLNFSGCFNGNVTFKRSVGEKDVSAYTVSNFAIIAATICSPDIWEEQGLIQKAVRNPDYARLWLYVALHIFSALRSTDYTRLQAPILDADPNEVLLQIEAGTYPVEQAQRLSILFVATNTFLRMRPNKTQATQNVLPLYFYVPTDCETQFGIILAIALAHYTLNNRDGDFVIPSINLKHQREFFGDPFVSACGNTAFSGRRANKALMQLVSLSAQEELSLSPDVAYALASALRSHKGGYAKLSDTTYRYLHNSRFSGLDGQFVINHMFQRGSCSFAIDHMLKTYFKDQYHDLPIHLQTEAIQSLGLSAYEVTEIERSTKLALLDAAGDIKQLVSSSVASGHALSNLVAGNAHGKDNESECLLKALGKPCVKDAYQHCVGCRYELRNKAQYAHYYMEFIRLTEEMKNYQEQIDELKRRQVFAITHGGCAALNARIDVMSKCYEKAKWLRNSVIYPCLQEIDAHIRTFADKRVLESYSRIQKSLMERGTTHGD